jgi:MYXO-CTERM domain-containing protein
LLRVRADPRRGVAQPKAERCRGFSRSQHGFFYNSNTGHYTFLDDPAERFHNCVEVTQIAGINNAGEISGFYSDSNGVFHGFVATPTPEPGALALIGIFASLVLARRRVGRD